MENWILWAGFGLLVLLLVTGAPFYVAFLAASIPILLWVAGVDGMTIGQLGINSVHSFTLVAIPLFVFMGNTMSASGAARALFDVARSFIGRMRAGTGMAAIVACALFGTMCGSGTATALAVGTVVVPELERNGYKKATCAAIIGAAGPLGLMIPPSIAFIIMGDVLGASVGALFLAGIVPGIVITIYLCIACYLSCRNKKEIKLEQPFSWGQRGRAISRALPAFLIPVVIIGGMYAGICTATEAAGVGCVASLLVGRLFYKGLTWKRLHTALVDTFRSCAAILCIVIGAVIFGRVTSFLGIPQGAAQWMQTLGLGKTAFMWMFLALFFVLGMIFDAFVLQFVCLPLVLPALLTAGYTDMIYVGILFTAIVMLGQITPPVGITLYAAAAGAGAGAGETIKESPPYIAALTASMITIAFVPALIIH